MQTRKQNGSSFSGLCARCAGKVACVLAFFGMTFLAVCGCQTLLSSAPPVDQALVARSGSPALALQEGRKLYLTKCGQCHMPMPIEGRPTERWRRVLPEMARRARLSFEEEARVGAYVFAVLDKPAAAGGETGAPVR